MSLPPAEGVSVDMATPGVEMSKNAALFASGAEVEPTNRLDSLNAELITTRSSDKRSSSRDIGVAVREEEPLPASEINRIPLGINKWVYLAILFVLYIFHGALVMNWQPILDYLTRDGVYSWKCFPSDVFDSKGTCAEQRKALGLLGTLGSVFIFCGSPFGAYLTDTLGPKISITIGLAVFIVSWLFLAVSSQSAQLYIPTFILQGLAVELTFFPMLTICNLFPANRGLILALLGTARSLSQYYSSAQQAMAKSIGLSATMWVCVAISAVWLVIMLFLAPSQKFKLVHDGKLDDGFRGLELPNKVKTKIELYAAGRKVFTFEFVLWLVYFSLGLTRVAFYGICVADQTPDVVTAFSYMAPLSFIPCPFFGWMADAFGGISVLIALNVLATLMYACLLGGGGAQWLAMVVDVILLSFMASMTYVYCDNAYSQLTQAKLAGISMLVGGLIMFINTPIYNWGVDSGSFLGPNIFYICAVCAMYPVLGFLWLRRKSMTEDKLPARYTAIIEAAEAKAPPPPGTASSEL